MNITKHDLLRSKLPKQLEIATTRNEFSEIWKLRREEFSKLYPGVTQFSDDVYDENACVLYSQNDLGEVISTGRIAFDSPRGLPADKLIKAELDELRQQGLSIAESSKFTINNEGKERNMLLVYFYAYYVIAKAHDIDSVIFIIPDKHVGLYLKKAGAKLLQKDVGYSYGTEMKFSLLECRVQEVDSIFKRFAR